jgi:lysophospholipase L1-like esterase
MTLQDDLNTITTKATQVSTDADLLHEMVHGDETDTVSTDSGVVPSLAKAIHDEAVTRRTFDLSNRYPKQQNLLDDSQLIDDTYILSNGNPASQSGWKATPFIFIFANENYSFANQVAHVAFYDYLRNFISYVAGVSAGGSVVAPANATYIRFSALNADLTEQVFVNGSELPDQFVSYSPDDRASAMRSRLEIVRNGIKSTVSSEFNYFDPDDAMENTALAANGSTYSFSDYITTEFILVNPGESWISSHDSNAMSFYDENKNHIMQMSITKDVSFVVPERGYYIRMHVTPLSASDELMLVASDTLPVQYTPHSQSPTATLSSAFIKSKTALLASLPQDFNAHDPDRSAIDTAINPTTGSTYGFSNYFTTDFIDILPGSQLIISHDSNAVCFYDIDREFISSNTSVQDNTAFTAPSNAHFVRLHIFNITFIDRFQLLRQAAPLAGFKPFDRNSRPWQGKKVSWVGDSISVAGFFITETLLRTGLITDNNFAVSGRSVRDMAKDAAGTDLTSGDLANTDIIHIFGGTNDYGGNRQLGSISDAFSGSVSESFYNDVFQTLESLYTLKPTVRIIFSTPLIRGAFSSQPVYPAANGVGATLPEYAQAIKDVCMLFGTPVCDLFSISGINLINLSEYTSDNLHPNSAGGILLAQSIAPSINSV